MILTGGSILDKPCFYCPIYANFLPGQELTIPDQLTSKGSKLDLPTFAKKKLSYIMDLVVNKYKIFQETFSIDQCVARIDLS